MDQSLYKPIKMCFLLLKTFGMWQDGNQSWIYLIFGSFAHIIFVQLYMTCMFIYSFQAEDLVDFTEAFGLASTTLGFSIRCLNFFYRINSIVKLVNSLEVLLKFSETQEHSVILRSKVRFGYNIMKIFWLFGLVSMVTAFFPPFFSHQLPYKFWLPFDTKNNESGFWIASVITLSFSPCTGQLAMVLDILPIIFLSFAIGLVEELRIRIEEVETKSKPEGSKSSQYYKNQLITCIKIHQKIKEYVEEIQNIFSYVFMIQGVISTATICTCAFVMSKVKKFY